MGKEFTQGLMMMVSLNLNQERLSTHW